MARRVFSSLHYQDVVEFRANVVRQHWITNPDRESAGFFDASIWETAKKTGSTAVKRLVNSGLDGTSLTCVLVGSRTYAGPWGRLRDSANAAPRKYASAAAGRTHPS
jgi:hypothetical protein